MPARIMGSSFQYIPEDREHVKRLYVLDGLMYRSSLTVTFKDPVTKATASIHRPISKTTSRLKSFFHVCRKYDFVFLSVKTRI